MKALAATPRTIAAIRKADAVLTVRPGGQMGKGAYPGGFGGGGASPYSGMFAVTDATDYSGEAPYSYKINMVGGLAQLESKYHTIAALADFAITEDGYLTLEFDVAEEGGAITYTTENKTTGDAAADLPLYKGRTIVARLTIADNKLTVIQTQYGVAIVSVRTPEEPEEETP